MNTNSNALPAAHQPATFRPSLGLCRWCDTPVSPASYRALRSGRWVHAACDVANGFAALAAAEDAETAAARAAARGRL